MNLIYVLLATSVISLGGLIGIIFLWVRKNRLDRWLHGLVAVSAGVLLGVTFFSLLPEASHTMPVEQMFGIFLIFFLAMFLVEKILHWHHCHKPDCQTHSIGYMNLIGDGIHNFVDGMLIASAFQVSPTLGLTTTIAVAIHEIPQEISDYGVLLYSGFSKKKALLANFGVALTAVGGGIFGLIATSLIVGITPYLLLLAAASFFYIASSDLMPELRKVNSAKQLVIRFSLLIAGVVLMYGLSMAFGHSHGESDYHQDEVGNDIGHVQNENDHDQDEEDIDHL